MIEGIDCAGKSTQAELLQRYFENQGSKSVLSPEPSSGPIGNLIREILKGRVFLTQDQEKFDEQMAYLFAADRHDHLYNDIDGVFKLVEQQLQVISTRYYFSSLAYNCYTQEQFGFVSRLNQNFPNPDLLIYIDLPVEVALSRLQDNRSSVEVYETKDKLAKVSQNYQKILRNYDAAFLKVDGTNPKETIYQQIVQFLQDNVFRSEHQGHPISEH